MQLAQKKRMKAGKKNTVKYQKKFSACFFAHYNAHRQGGCSGMLHYLQTFQKYYGPLMADDLY